MASVTQRRPGVWKVQVRVGGSKETGWRYKSWTVDAATRTPDFPNGVRSKKDAERFGEIEEHKIAAMTARFVAPSNEKLETYLTRWLEGKQDLRRSTRVRYEGLLRTHVYPVLGKVALDALSPAMVQAMLDDMTAGKGAAKREESPRTVQFTRAVLRAALHDAVRLGVLAANPLDRTKAPKQRPRRDVAYTVEQAEALFTAADATRFGPLLRFLCTTGLRRGEALGLRWEDVDEKAGMMTVRRAVVVAGEEVIVQEPKTEAGIRTVALPAPARDALEAQRRVQRDDKRKALAAGRPYGREGWVFATRDGNHLHPKNVGRDYIRARRAAQEAAAKAGPKGVSIPDLPLHALRHTAVSLLLAAGVPLEIISKLIGHKNWALTLQTYSHLLPETTKQAADALDAFLADRFKPAAKPAK